MPIYLSGQGAEWAFSVLRRGARLFGTLHARTAAEAVRVMCWESGVHRSELTAPFMLIVVEAHWSGNRIVRKLSELAILPPAGEPIDLLAASGADALATWTGLPAPQVRTEIADKVRLLGA